MIEMDYNSLYPGVVLSSPSVMKADNSTIESSLVPVQPMNPPSRYVSYMDFQCVSPWVEKYEHIPGVIRVKIKDTFDNILNLIENPDIIVARILDFKIDVQFINGYCLRGTYRDFENTVLGLYTAEMKLFTDDRCPIIERDTQRDTLIEFDAIIYAPLTKFVKRNAIVNHKKEFWKEDLLVDYTCKRLIEDIFRTKRDC